MDAEHKPVKCFGCGNDADRWYEDPKATNDTGTLFICVDCLPLGIDCEEMRNSAGKFVEVGVYCCSEYCPECN